MKNTKLIILSLLACFASACNDNEPDTPPSYRFYVEFTNHAWGFEHKGLFINNDGEVYFFQLDQPSALTRDDNYTEHELEAYFAHNKSYLTTIGTLEFKNMVRQSETVEMDQLSDPVNECMDAGIYRYSTFDYDKNSGTYSDLLLYQTGDWRIVNHDINAITLRDTLITLALDHNIALDLGHSGFCTGLADD